jgi:hypothetical protein
VRRALGAVGADDAVPQRRMRLLKRLQFERHVLEAEELEPVLFPKDLEEVPSLKKEMKFITELMIMLQELVQ